MTLRIGDYQISSIVTNESWCENCYLVRHILSNEQVIIDPGDSIESIIQCTLEQNSIVKKILITHAHHDHIGAVDALHKRFKVPCYMHKSDTRLARQAHTYALVMDHKRIEPFAAPFSYVNDEILEIGNNQIKVICTPGHTSGSVCYDFGDFIFTGDTILYQHIGRTDTPGANKKLLLSSVNQLMEQLCDEKVMFPGHGRSWTVREARKWWKDIAMMPQEYRRFGEIS
jgi:hydroxyacylglutathione hydrolase